MTKSNNTPIIPESHRNELGARLASARAADDLDLINFIRDTHRAAVRHVLNPKNRDLRRQYESYKFALDSIFSRGYRQHDGPKTFYSDITHTTYVFTD